MLNAVQVLSAVGLVSTWRVSTLDRRQLELPPDDKQNSRPTTIGQACSGSSERRRIGHRQAGSEVVCVDKHRGKPRDCGVQGGDGYQDRPEVPADGPIAKRVASGGARTDSAVPVC